MIEYVGEVLDTEMCKQRLQKAHESSTTNFYMLTLDSFGGRDCKKERHAFAETTFITMYTNVRTKCSFKEAF